MNHINSTDMKKLFILALAAAGVASVSAQECKQLYEQGKKLEDVFNKEKPSMTKPNNQITADGAAALLQANEIYQQVVECEKAPNAKGKVEDKLTKKIHKSLKEHAEAGDYNKAAIVLFNADKKYPEAYNAFMLSGTETSKLGTVADTVYAVDFYNAGNTAYSAGQFAEAAKAYAAARKANAIEPEAYVYNIDALRRVAMADTTYDASDDIFAIAGEGIERFGAGNEYLYNNYIQHYIDKEDYDNAIKMLDKQIAAEPGNANLYRLRAIVNFYKKEFKASIPDFLKVGELGTNFGYVRDAANTVNKIGKAYLANATSAQKEEILGIFDSALKIANQAKALEGADGSVDEIIDDINYNIDNANKL